MSEMGSHDPFGRLKHKLWPKKGPGVKLAVWLPTIKSRESPRSPYVWVACDILLESSGWGLQFCLKPHLNQRFAHKGVGPQSRGSPNFRNFEIHTWESWEKCHLDAGLVTSHRIYYKAEGGGLPQVRAMVNLVNLSLFMVRPSSKNVQIMH
jgi:hypothetical protein